MAVYTVAGSAFPTAAPESIQHHADYRMGKHIKGPFPVHNSKAVHLHIRHMLCYIWTIRVAVCTTATSKLSPPGETDWLWAAETVISFRGFACGEEGPAPQRGDLSLLCMAAPRNNEASG